MILQFKGRSPRIGDNVFIAPTALVLGDVRIADGASIFFGAVLRGDHGTIFIGAGSNVQDNATIHVPEGKATTLDEDVTIGHGAILEGCHVRSGAVIGMNAVVLEGAEVGEEAMVAAGSVVAEGATIPPGTLVAGAPARVKKELGGSAREWIRKSAPAYHRFRDEYLKEGLGEC